jgi:hypothetical protein
VKACPHFPAELVAYSDNSKHVAYRPLPAEATDPSTSSSHDRTWKRTGAPNVHSVSLVPDGAGNATTLMTRVEHYWVSYPIGANSRAAVRPAGPAPMIRAVWDMQTPGIARRRECRDSSWRSKSKLRDAPAPAVKSRSAGQSITALVPGKVLGAFAARFIVAIDKLDNRLSLPWHTCPDWDGSISGKFSN